MTTSLIPADAAGLDAAPQAHAASGHAAPPRHNPVRFATQGLNRLTEEQLREHQWRRLERQIDYCLGNSDFYRRRFADLGIERGDIAGLDDFLALPVLMDKEQERLSQQESLERHGHPYGAHLCADPADVTITATTSGTTGVPTFTYTHGRGDEKLLADAMRLMLGHAGVLPGERVLFAHALGIYATSVALPAIRAAGVLPVDVDVRGGTDALIQFAELTGPVALMTTPSLAQYLIDAVPAKTGRTVAEWGLRALFVVGEIGVGIPEVKAKIEGAYGCRVYDWIAPAGQTLAFSCDSEKYHGMHAVTPDNDLYPLDIVDPDTRTHIDPVNGAVGEAVYTSMGRTALPLLRFASGDIVTVLRGECPGCGFQGTRLRVTGRSDDLLIVKGANVYPAAIRTVVNEFVPEVTGNLRIVLTQEPPRVEPPLVLRIERGELLRDDDLPGLEQRIAHELHARVRLTPVVEWVEFGLLERAVTKTPLFEKRY